MTIRPAARWLAATAILCTFSFSRPVLRAETGTPHDAFAGIWTLSPDDRGGPASVDSGSPRRREGGSGGGRGYGGGGGGRGGGRGGYGGGGGGYGGGGGGFGGGRGGRGAENPEEAQAIADFSRSLMAPVKQVTIVVHESSVSITDNEGGVLVLDTSNKKVSSRAENGFVKLTRKSRWDGSMLISEIEVEKGPKFEQKYEVAADGAQLRVSTSSGGDNKRVITHVYERPES